MSITTQTGISRAVMRLGAAPLMVLVLMWSYSAGLYAQTARETATGVKVGYIYNFLRYVSWPQEALGEKDPLVVAIVDDRELATELSRAVADRTLDGRPLAVRRALDAAGARGAHVVFVAGNSDSRLREISAAAGPVLIITEADKALDHGSVINFVEMGGRIRFEVSVVAAQQRRLAISSRMLAVALNVRTSMMNMLAAIQVIVHA